MDFPFIKSDKEWEALHPREADELGRRTDLDSEQQRLIGVFRVMDMRSEWCCRQNVKNHNWLLMLSALFMVIEGPKILATITIYLQK